MAEDKPRRQVAQGKKGGYYIVGSEKTVGGRKRKQYISKEEYARMMGASGKQKKPELVEAKQTAAVEPKGAQTTKTEDVKVAKVKADKVTQGKGTKLANADSKPSKQAEAESRTDKATGLYLAGRKPKKRNSRLPEPGTKMVTVDKIQTPMSAIEDAATGVITIYDKNDKPIAMGYSLTAAVSAYYGKAMPAYAMFGLKTEKQKKAAEDRAIRQEYKRKERERTMQVRKDERQRERQRKREEREANKPPKEPKEKKPRKRRSGGSKSSGASTGDNDFHFGKMKMRQKVKNWFRQDANTIRIVKKKNFDQLSVTVNGKRLLIQQKVDDDGKPIGPIYAKEQGKDNKPFKISRKWVEQQQRRGDTGVKREKLDEGKDTKEPVTVTGTRKLSNAESMKKAFEISSHIDTPNDVIFDVHADGIIIRSCIGRISGFVPFEESLSGCADEIMKAIPDTFADVVRIDFSDAPRMNDDGNWSQMDSSNGYIRSEVVEAIPEKDCMVKAFCYDKSRMDFIGFATVDELCKALHIED